MIKYIATTQLIILLGFLYMSCENQETEIHQRTNAIENQVHELSSDDMNAFKAAIIRYVGRKPEDASHENKFDPYFDEHYEEQVEIHNLEFYAQKQDSTYFILTRIAPSLELKRVAIGGFAVINTDGVMELEEVFRTWKRTPEELKPINELLFSKLLSGVDLSPYYTKNMGLDAYIEFPSDEVWYDHASHTWMSSREDILKPFYDEKILRTQQVIDSLKTLNDTPITLQ
jgi:hypothetical protein